MLYHVCVCEWLTVQGTLTQFCLQLYLEHVLFLIIVHCTMYIIRNMSFYKTHSIYFAAAVFDSVFSIVFKSLYLKIMQPTKMACYPLCFCNAHGTQLPGIQGFLCVCVCV